MKIKVSLKGRSGTDGKLREIDFFVLTPNVPMFEKEASWLYGQEFDIDLPDPPKPEPEKTPGQRAYEAHEPPTPWIDLPANPKDYYHKLAAAVLGTLAPEIPKPIKKVPGERMFLAELEAKGISAYPHNWHSLPIHERRSYEKQAAAYDASAPKPERPTISDDGLADLLWGVSHNATVTHQKRWLAVARAARRALLGSE